MAAVAFRDIKKSFGSVEVIRAASFEIHDGEFLVLVGPSGCGKSTLLRILAGLEETSSGQVLIGGQVVNEVEPKDRDIAMVFQSYALYPHMTVAENMGFALSLQKVDKQAVASRVAHAAGILNLAPLLARYPRELSGGQRQRVAMGRAIVRDPKVFLFDEPLSNLDAKLRVSMRSEIRALHQRLKATTVYVTHDQVEAMTMADRIVVMRDGRIEQIGTPLALYDWPRNLFVAQFIGSPAMNVIEGVVHQAEPGGQTRAWLEDEQGQRWPLAPGLVAPGRRLHYGVRPEDIAVNESAAPACSPGDMAAASPAAASMNLSVAAEVLVVEPIGPQTEVLVRAGPATLTVVMPGRPQVQAGERISLAIATARVHLFDHASGERIDARESGGST